MRRVVACVLVAAVVASICIALAMYSGNEASSDVREDDAASRSIKKIGSKRRIAKNSGQIAKSRKSWKNSKIAEEIAKDTEIPSVGTVDADFPDEEEPLTEQQKSVRKELQDGLDSNDLKAVRSAIAKFKESSARGGLDGGATESMRRQAVDALAWFGKDGAVDLIEFICDPEESIASDAYDKFEMAMNSVDMSQAECSMYLKAIMTALTDSERIDNLLVNLARMDNSVKADTIIDILENGTAEAKEVMREKLEFYTDAGVNSVEDVEKWSLVPCDE